MLDAFMALLQAIAEAVSAVVFYIAASLMAGGEALSLGQIMLLLVVMFLECIL